MILIDTREDVQRGGRLPGKTFMEMFPTGTAREMRLEFGDFAFHGNGPGEEPIAIGVERKTLSDLYKSMTSGRLTARQLPGMAEHYDRAYLLVEGDFRADRLGRVNVGGSTLVKRATLENFLISVNEFYGVRVIRSENRHATPDVIMNLYNWWSRPYKSHKSHTQIYSHGQHIRFVRPNQILKILAACDGIGSKMALSAARRFETVGKMLQTDEKDLARTKHWGKKSAEKFFFAFWGARNNFYRDGK